MIDHIISLLWDGIANGFFIPLRSEATLAGLQGFGRAAATDYVVAALGGALGALLSWIVGWMIWRVRRYARWKMNDEVHATVRSKILPYAYLLLFFTPFSVGGFLPLAAGFMLMDVTLVMAIVFVSRLVYYALHLI